MSIVTILPTMSFVSNSNNSINEKEIKDTQNFDWKFYKLIESIEKGAGPDLNKIYEKMNANEDHQFNIKLITNVSDDFNPETTIEEKYRFFKKENLDVIKNILETFSKEITYSYISEVSPVVKIRVKEKNLEKLLNFLKEQKTIKFFSYNEDMLFVDKEKFAEAIIAYHCVAIDSYGVCTQWYNPKEEGPKYFPPETQNAVFYNASNYKGIYEKKLKAVSAFFQTKIDEVWIPKDFQGKKHQQKLEL